MGGGGPETLPGGGSTPTGGFVSSATLVLVAGASCGPPGEAQAHPRCPNAWIHRQKCFVPQLCTPTLEGPVPAARGGRRGWPVPSGSIEHNLFRTSFLTDFQGQWIPPPISTHTATCRISVILNDILGRRQKALVLTGDKMQARLLPLP